MFYDLSLSEKLLFTILSVLIIVSSITTYLLSSKAFSGEVFASVEKNKFTIKR